MMSAQHEPRRFNVTEYYQMAEAGVLRPDDRVELIEGEVIKMSPIGSKHAACVKRLNGLLVGRFGPKAVSVQDPVRLNDYSEPEPDIALLNARDDYYELRHPTAADTRLVIEVADTTVLTDRNRKIPVYARAGVPEVWLVNLPAQTIEVFSNPREGVYQNCSEFKRGEVAISATLTDFSPQVNEILG
jgi:Uma2 family endonuclease